MMPKCFYIQSNFRPELVIDRSSPVKQNIGDFVDEEEKILALFKVVFFYLFVNWEDSLFLHNLS